ncbi:MAG: DeoR/GlpR family DNA-binding transcription regulator [Treponema sp.]|nr:DeoR/GlpR family DNA-binding transcription regulator [Treponema sp.]
MGKKIERHYVIKKRIARAAAATVEDGDTIMVESGSCCALFAEELANTKKDVTIITNSVFIANYISHAPNIKMILLGGLYQPDTQVMTGPGIKNCVSAFPSDKFFIGADGFAPKFGFTGKDHQRVQTILDMSEYTGGIVVLTDSEKFKHQGVHGLAHIRSVREVFTDKGIPDDSETILMSHGVTIHKVDNETDDDARAFPRHPNYFPLLKKLRGGIHSTRGS